MARQPRYLSHNRLLSPQPLYRVEEWAKNTGIKEIYNIDSSLLNDDRIAKTLDAINSSRGAVKTEIALQVSKSFQIPLKQIHWDLTSFHFTGEYENQERDHIQIVYTKNHPNESAKKSAKIGLDVAKDKYGQVPIYYEELDGNASGTLVDSFLNAVNYILRGSPVYVHLNGRAS